MENINFLSLYLLDKLSSQFPRQNEILLLTPRSLQLLQQLGLFSAISQKGVRHYKFDIYYQDKTNATQQSSTDQESIRLWENESTEFNYCISCEKSVFHQLLKEHLEQMGISIDYKQEVLDIENQTLMKPIHNQRSLSSPDIYPLTSSLMSMSMYYQYRPLPTPEESTKSIFLKNTDTQALKVLRSSVVIGADGQTSFVRQKLGIFLFDLLLHSVFSPYSCLLLYLHSCYRYTIEKQPRQYKVHKDILYTTDQCNSHKFPWC